MGFPGLKTIRDIFKKRHREQVEESRIIYYGDVPTIEVSSSTAARISATSIISRESIPEQDEEAAKRLEVQYKASNDSEEVKVVLDSFTAPTTETSTANNSSTRIPKNELDDRKGRPTYCSNVMTTSRYTIYSFLYKTLWEQFTRCANFYFLIVFIIQILLLKKSPVSPVTSGLPLVFVIVVSAGKQLYEDLKRHEKDSKVNNAPVTVVRDNKLIQIQSQDVRVGDVIKLEGENQVPADILVVGSSDEFQRCQVSTANLDGETNLKMRYCPPGLWRFRRARDFDRLHAILECDQPSPDLYSFSGNLLLPPNQVPPPDTQSSLGLPRTTSFRRASLKGKQSVSTFVTVPVSMDNMLLRGTTIKNTEFVFGLVVYTGVDTRLARNSKPPAMKYSTISRIQSRFITLFAILLVLMGVFSTIYHYVWLAQHQDWYLGITFSEEWDFVPVVDNLLAFFILYNYIIPISLYVTAEMQKVIGALFFVWDSDMQDPPEYAQPMVNTTDVNDELGQINYLFTDKTGTLTENIMKFRYCSIGADKFSFDDGKLRVHGEESDESGKEVDLTACPPVLDFLRTIALCHSVNVVPVRHNPSLIEPARLQNIFANLTTRSKNGSSPNPISSAKSSTENVAASLQDGWQYQASSPDEKALVESCEVLGVKFKGDREEMLTLDVLGNTEVYKRHYVLEFDSDRKCMSVIVEDKNKDIWLLLKGAESTVVPRCVEGPTNETLQAVMDFSMLGTRTLVVAKRKLTREELAKFSTKLQSARRMLKNREETMRKLYHSIENQLTCIGATGVEDQLQEGIPDMLQSLVAAGIHVWMLTGDKTETGVSVAMACGLLKPTSKCLNLVKDGGGADVKSKLEALSSEVDNDSTLVVDGESLESAFRTCPDELIRISERVQRVLCCRMSPLQKAKVVQMVKSRSKNCVTAAVGDGANDVAMIQEAHVGIGIIGKEGRQAARCADFALSRTWYLKKTILVHGHWYYVRLATLVVYFFYKNIIFVAPQFWYGFFCGFSGTSFYGGLVLMGYNILYAAAPIFAYGVQEQPYTASQLMLYPNIYKVIADNRNLRWPGFLRWIILAVYHSLVCFFIPVICARNISPATDKCELELQVNTGIVAVANLKLLVETKYLTLWSGVAYLFSFLTLILSFALYTETSLDEFLKSPTEQAGACRHAYFNLLTNVNHWAVVFLVIVISLTPDIVYRVLADTEKQSIFDAPPPIRQRSKRPGSRRKVFPSLKLSTLMGRSRKRLAVSNTTLQSYTSRKESEFSMA